jgi:hypothetical protein
MLHAAPVQVVNHSLFGEKKFRIAVLTLLTFIAMC